MPGKRATVSITQLAASLRALSVINPMLMLMLKLTTHLPHRAMGALGSPAHIPAMQHNLSALSITPAEGDTSFSRCFRGHKNSMVLKDVAIMGSIGPQRHHQLHAAGRGYVLCGSDDGTTCVWDACNGMLVRMLPALEPEAGITTCIGVSGSANLVGRSLQGPHHSSSQQHTVCYS